jgi:hypothetical protein
MSKKSTIHFEPVNGYLVRLYGEEACLAEHLKYHGVVTIEIDGDKAAAKGALGTLTHRNRQDIQAELKRRGVLTCSWERYDKDGKCSHLAVVKI